MKNQINSAQDWLDSIPKMRLFTLESEQDASDLHQKSRPVEIFGKELEQFCHSLIEHMNIEKGIGLAAPQMGIFQRIFVSQVYTDEEPLIVINPKIRPSSESKALGEEGCLSVPGILADVERWPSIDMTAQDAYGKPFELHLEGTESVCFQHENDHLEGILFTDYLTRSQIKQIEKHFAEQAAAEIGARVKPKSRHAPIRKRSS